MKYGGDLAQVLLERNDVSFGIVSKTRTRWWRAYRAATDSFNLDPHESRFHMAAAPGLAAWVEAILKDKRNPWEEAIGHAKALSFEKPVKVPKIARDWQVLTARPCC